MKEAFKILNKVTASLRLLNDAHLGQGDKQAEKLKSREMKEG